MGEQVGERIETSTHAAEQLERLVRYGERLVTGMLPVVAAPPDSRPLPEPTFRRNLTWQDHQLDLPLTGLLVGNLNVNLLEGNGVSQLFLNLNYLFPRTYLVASAAPARLTPIRITGRSLFVDNQQKVGAVAHVREVFESNGSETAPVWAQNILSRYQEQPWRVIQCREAADAVSTFQRAVSRAALPGMRRVYDEVATEYGFISFRGFSWRQFSAKAT